MYRSVLTGAFHDSGQRTNPHNEVSVSMDVRRVALSVAGLGVGFVGLGLAVTPWLGSTELARCRTYGAPAFRGIDGWMLVGYDGCNEIRFSLFAALGFVLLLGAGVIGATYLYQRRLRPYITKTDTS